jgi:hypothetical protein
VWPFDRLPYSDFSNNTTFPPEHAIEGVVNRCFEYVFGIYQEKEPSKRQYKKKKLDDGITESVVTPAFVPIYRPSYHATKPPYSCTAAEYKRCRAWLKCVLIPIGVTDRSDWFLDIKLYSMFKISQWKIFILVYWKFILTILEGIDQWYRKFFDLVGEKIRMLLSFSVAKSSVQQLQKEMDEMICWWESYFPPPFQLHQVMELVSSIPLFGSQHSWSELFGEKVLGQLKTLKKNSNPGGLSYERYMMNKCVDRELNTMARFYSKAVNETNQKAPNSTVKVSFDSESNALSFKVMQFAVYDPERTKSTFCPEDINHFVKLCLSEVLKRYEYNETECVKNSCFYRLVKSMQEHLKSRKETYFEKLTFITDKKNGDLDLFSPQELALAKALLNFKPQFYRQAWIYGLQFRSRGSILRVHANGDEGIDWKDKKNYSSWCKLLLAKSSSYGHLNAFFEVSIGDNSVDGLLVASVTSYKSVPKAPNLVDIVYHDGNMDRSNVFIALQDIYPTRIATIPFGNNHLPIKITRQGIPDTKIVNGYRQQLSYSYMLLMDPDKISRMPEKRPYTLYLSPCTSDKTTKYSLNDLSNSATTKLTYQIQKVNGQRYVVAKKVIKPSCTPSSSESSAPLHNNSSLGEGSRTEAFQEQQQHQQLSGTKKIVIKPRCTPSSSESSAPLHNNSSLVEGSRTEAATIFQQQQQHQQLSGTKKIVIKPKCTLSSSRKSAPLKNNSSVSKGSRTETAFFPPQQQQSSGTKMIVIKPKCTPSPLGISALSAPLHNNPFLGEGSRTEAHISAIIKPNCSPSYSGTTSAQLQYICTEESPLYNIAIEPSLDVGCCNFCGESTRDCNLIYTGNNSYSSISQNLRFSFPWRKNSCAIDSVGSSLQMLYSNLNMDGKKIMEQFCPDLCQLFGMLSEGTISTFTAKEALENHLGERLRTNQDLFLTFHQHQFASVVAAFDLYRIRLPSFPELQTVCNNVPMMFASTLTITEGCPEKCNGATVRTKHNVSYDEFFVPLFAENEPVPTLERCVRGNRGVSHCTVCSRELVTTYTEFRGALAVKINMFKSLTRKNKSPLLNYVPDQINLADTSYTLSGCIYSYESGVHFVSMVRDFTSHRLLYCDGMENNAQFVEWNNSSASNFPRELPNKMILNSTYYVCSKYIAV